MPLQVDYLSKIAQFAGEARRQHTEITGASTLVNRRRALEWMATQTNVNLGFENGRLSESELDGRAPETVQKGGKKGGSEIDFIDNVGAKLKTLRRNKFQRAHIDESLETVWFPKHMFDKFGREVFELDHEGGNDLHAKVSIRERRAERNPTSKPQDVAAEDERQTELAAALRWAAVITSQT